MNITYRIARKYLWARRKTGFISVIASISVAGVTLGTAALIMTLCIVSGFERDMRAKFVGFDAHLRVKTFDGTELISPDSRVGEWIRAMPEVTGMSPYIEKEAMIRSSRSTDGVVVKGVDEDRVDSVLDLSKDVIQTRGARKIDLRRDSASVLGGILIGQKLADKLHVQIGDKLTLFSMKSPFAFIEQPRVRQFTLTGIYRSGLAEYDNVMVYVDLAEAQNLFNMGPRFHGFEIRLQSLDQATSVADVLGRRLGYPYYVRTWFDAHRNLFGWLETNNFLMMLIFSLIIMVAAFNIVGTIFMIVIEKTKDIGVLKAMGARPVSIRNIFMLEGLLIGACGALAGSALAWLLLTIQQEFKVISLSSDVYFMDAVPVEIRLVYFIPIMAAAIAMCVLASWLPSLKASRLNPVDAIRYE